MIPGFWQFFLLTLRLNFRSGRAIAYGYIMPVIFLIGFGSIFRAGEPLLLAQMGQILTITILGGACLGMPTALVGERERGIWRRYQLLPVSVNALLVVVLLVRVVILAGAVLLQMGLARWIFGTPFPPHGGQLVVAFLVVTFAFLGLGLIVAALAPDVPAVQALGQCLFLPMILIGGVGVPLVALPEWAQGVASFMPGRYAVETLQGCFFIDGGLRQMFFPIVALVVIGVAAGFAGMKLLRWEPEVRIGPKSWVWIGLALLAWASVGITAVGLDRIAPAATRAETAFESLSEEDIAGISFDRLPDDGGFYAPLAPPLAGERLSHRMEEFLPRLSEWKPGRHANIAQSVRNLLSVAAIADISQDPSERLVARIVYEHLCERWDAAVLARALAWVILEPEAGTVITAAPELGFSRVADAGIVRERNTWYAKKFLGRIRGEIPSR